MAGSDPSSPLIPRQVFFENAHALDPILSPDGRWLSWRSAVNGVMNVWLAPRDDLNAKRPLTRQTDRPIAGHWFARTNEHILFAKDRDGDENFHLWCVGFKDVEPRDLTPFADVLAHLIGFHYDDPYLIAVGMNDRDARWHDLYTVDIRTGERRLIHENLDEIASYIVDRQLGLKLATSTRGKGRGNAILRWNGRAFDEVTSIQADDVLLTSPLHCTLSGDAWYLQSSIGVDKARIMRVDWHTGEETVIASHPHADVTSVLLDPRTDEVVAASSEYLQSEWITVDAEVSRDLAKLARDLDGTVEVASQSDDQTLWIVAASRPDRPFAWYLLDRSSGALTKLFSARPKLDGVVLSPVQAVVVRSRDGLDLVCYLTLPRSLSGAKPHHPLPMVLEVHGGPWARDSWAYNRWVQWYADRGYAVLQVNYRGSTGFGKAFVNAGDREWAGRMHDDLIDAVDWAIGEGVADPKRIAICGGSYGGYAAFVGATFTPDTFCCSVPIVGITNLETMLANPPPYWAAFYEQECHRVGDPRTEEGRALLRSRSPLHRAGAITKPMLIGHGANDVRCKITESDQMVAAMRARNIPVTYVVFPDEGHGFARPENDIAFNAIMEAFLARHLGGRLEPVGDDFNGSSHEIRAGGELLGLQTSTVRR